MNNENETRRESIADMTMRDILAAVAMHGAWVHEGADQTAQHARITAEWAYNMADAMLSERKHWE